MWIKSVPKRIGTFHIATRQGEYAGTREVISMLDRTDTPGSGGFVDTHELAYIAGKWEGWWWDMPIEIPPAPPPWELGCASVGCDHLADSDIETFAGFCEECYVETFGTGTNETEPELE